MKAFTLAILGAASLATAAPLNNATEPLLYKRDFQGTINYFSRYDCTNPCVEDGMCLSGQTGTGDLLNIQSFLGWDAECWDRPAGAHSASFSVDNGHGFTAIDKSCADFKKDGYVANIYFKGGSSDNSKPTCMPMNHHHVKAVYYNW